MQNDFDTILKYGAAICTGIAWLLLFYASVFMSEYPVQASAILFFFTGIGFGLGWAIRQDMK